MWVHKLRRIWLDAKVRAGQLQRFRGILIILFLGILLQTYFRSSIIQRISKLGGGLGEIEEWESWRQEHLNKPLTMDTLQLCAPAPWRRQLFDCPHDWSCVDCIRQNLSVTRPPAAQNYHRLEKFKQQFRSTVYLNRVAEIMLERFGPPTPHGTIVLIVTGGEAHMEFVINFMENPFLKRGEYLLVCTDDESFETASKLGYDPMPVVWNGTKELIAAHRGVALQMHIAKYLVELNYNVLLQDTDLVWLKDPRPILNQVSRVEGLDMLTLWAPSGGLVGPTNTGFIYLSNKRKYTTFLKDFMGSLVEIYPLMMFYWDSSTDQAMWNALLKNDYFNQVNYRILPQDKFIVTRPREKKDIEDAYIVHFVASFKKERMIEYGLWSLQDAEKMKV